MLTQLRIVAGSLRGRKVSCVVDPNLRPTPDMVREAFFNILGPDIPGRSFFDVFAGTGVIGIEALSRGAKDATFVERDFRRLAEIEGHLDKFEISDRGLLARTDVYRWVERWQPPAEPVNVFVSPPFADYERRVEGLLAVVTAMQSKLSPGSVLTVQMDRDKEMPAFPDAENWEERRYGRNYLLIWVKKLPPAEQP